MERDSENNGKRPCVKQASHTLRLKCCVATCPSSIYWVHIMNLKYKQEQH